jgi:hypothetical protein
VRRLAASVALYMSLAAPAQAQWLVFDVKSVTTQLESLKKEIALVRSAQQELQSIPASLFAATDASGRLRAVQQTLQAAKAACEGVTNGRVMPSVCNVRSSVADQQAASIGQDLTNLQSLRNAASGSTGNLAIAQTNAAALISIGQQLQDQKTRDLAAEQQREYENALRSRAYSAGGHVHLGSSQ